jgi:hypothetical protein
MISRMRSLRVSFAVLSLSLSASAPVFAHAALLSPTPRTPSDADIKHCPCGGGAGAHDCSSGPTSDPNRSTNITTFQAGETITVQLDEYVGHTGRIRIAFDDDGADLVDFNAHVLADVPDPSGDGGTKSIQVTLPNTPCDNCTLQMIQVMNGDTQTPIANPTGDSTYFDCADIVLIGASEGEGDPPAGEGEGEAPAGEGEGEGEGDGDGEGEGEGDADAGGSCASAGLAAPAALAALLRRRRR